MSLLQEYLTLPNFTEPRLDQSISNWLVPEAKENSPFLVHGDRGSDNKAFEAKILRDLEETSVVRSWLSLVQSPNSGPFCLPFRSSVLSVRH
jgi:hypothetical protein